MALNMKNAVFWDVAPCLDRTHAKEELIPINCNELGTD
jgi:hypothetical protein